MDNKHAIDLDYFIRNANNLTLLISEWLHDISRAESVYKYQVAHTIQVYNDLMSIAEKLHLSVDDV